MRCTNMDLSVLLEKDCSIPFLNTKRGQDECVVTMVMLVIGCFLTEWSLFKMFSRTLTEACPLASSSKVYVDVTDNPQVCIFTRLLTLPNSTFYSVGRQFYS
jgi:hypothetical protein